LNDRSDKPPVVHAVVGIAVACLLRTINVDARTVPDQLTDEPITTQCGRPLGGFLAPDFLVCDPSQTMRRPERSIAVPPETVKRPQAKMAKMPKSPLATAASLRQNPSAHD
jgi:hypothetical protein